MKKPWYKQRKFSDGYKYKIVLEKILEFLHRMPDDAFQWAEKKNYRTDDYTLKQFHWYIAKKIDEEEYHETI